MKKILTTTLLYLSLNQLFAQDAALAPPGGNITSPVTACALTNGEIVTIRIFNFGPGTINTNIDVTYNITGPVASTATETIIAPGILANSSYTYSFAAPADFSVEGVYNIDVSLVSIGDPNTTNDAYNGYTVTHNAASVGGTLAGSGPVCDGNNSGNLTLSGHTGNILNWEFSTDGGFTWFNISNITTSQSYNDLTVETWYRSVVQNSTCSSVTSAIGIMTIDPISNAGTVSGPNSVCQGSNIALSVTAGTGSIDHWEYSTDGGVTWVVVANTTNNYTHVGGAPPTVRFRVFVISGTCAGDYSNVKVVTVNPSTIGGTVTADATECSGINGATLTLAGHTGTITRWQSSIDGGTIWSNIANTTTTQSYLNLTQSTMYRAQVKSGSCIQLNSVPATITIVTASVGGAVSSNVTECYNSNNDTLVLAGESGTILNWESSIDGGVIWTPIVNSTNEEIYTNLTQTTQYRAAVQAGTCPIGYSTAATVTVDTLSEGGTISGAATFCSGSNSGSVILTGNEGTINNWEYSQDGGTIWNNIVNTTSSNSFLNLTGTTLYRASVQSGICPADYSDTVTITIDSLSLGGNVTSNMTVCSGNNSDTLFLNANRGVVMNWEFSTDGGFIWSSIVNDTTFQIFNNVTQNTQYRALVKSGVCASEYSTPVSVSVDATAVGGNIIGSSTVCSSGNAGALTLVGHTTSIVQWETSTDGGATWNPVANTSTIENYTNLMSTTTYRSIVSSGVCPNDTSSTATIFVDTTTLGGIVSIDDTLCANSGGDTLTLAGYNGSVLNWEMSSDGGSTWITLSNTSDEQIYNNLLLTTMFRAQTKNGVCASVTATPATITINPQSDGGVVNSNSTGCEGYNSGTMVLSGFQGTIIDWESSTDGIVWNSLAIDTVSSINYNDLIDTTYFHAIVQSGTCNADTSIQAYVTVYPKPHANFISDTVCEGASITFMNSSTINNGFITLYNWNFGDNNSQIQTNPVHIYADSGAYNVTLVAMSNFGCLDTIIIPSYVNSLPDATITPTGVTTFCEGDSVLLLVALANDYTYLWNTGDTLNTLLADSTGSFSVLVTDTITGCINTDNVDVTVFPSPIANAGPDTTLSLGTSYEMIGSGGAFYAWSPGSSLNDSTIAQPMATPAETTLYILTVSDINGCSDVDSIEITLDENISFNVPNLITPNGDGFNDTWIIPNILSFPDNSMVIVNRNGQVVFEMTGYDNTWDGTFNGNTLPDGTYYYVLEIEGTDNPKKGAINIVSSDK
jgi:gliding motility-associated-like protein